MVKRGFRQRAARALLDAFLAAHGPNVSIDFGDPPLLSAVSRAVFEVSEVLHGRPRWAKLTDNDLHYLEGYVASLADFFPLAKDPALEPVVNALRGIAAPIGITEAEIETRLGAALMKLPPDPQYVYTD